MKPSALIILLAGLCLAETVFLVGLVGGRVAYPSPQVQAVESRASSGAAQGGVPANTATAAGAPATPAPAELVRQNQELTTKLAEVSKELEARKSEISFSYGSVRESGRFVGMTFRKMFEAAAAREATEAKARVAENQINIYSLGPFIQDAEVFESDPVSFAQFQAPLIGEVLGVPADRASELEGLLSDLKAKSLKLEEGSAEWLALNDQALQRVTALLSDGQKEAMKSQIGFFQQYGVLVIPAYSILRAPTPTVVNP